MSTQQLIETAVSVNALRFGNFTLKSGRESPYFFNAGAFCTGKALNILAKAYAEKIYALQSALAIDVLYGPAYKGIPLVAAVATQLYQDYGLDLPWAFNRKEAKNHGEGGVLVGADVRGKQVLLIDDVLTAGTAIRESLTLLENYDAKACAVVVALDRAEILREGKSAIQLFNEETKLPTHALLHFQDLLEFVRHQTDFSPYLEALEVYRAKYGAMA
ncbi:MAG: orotate phosphoribosyltransferase [Cardiobacteriaceae bacterium]|nr:orotate phosphoribosyltransferase [Cardiobacteriaceae bacterium]